MKSIIALAAIAIMASPSFAATATKKTTKTTTTTTTTTKNEAPAHSERATNSYSSANYAGSVTHSGINWQAGLGLGTAGSQFHFGARVQGLVPVGKIESGDILVGGETGFLFGPSSPSTWIIPIMAQGQYNFKQTGSITPYVGLSMGIGIFHANIPSGLTAAAAAAGVTISSTSTDFAMLAKGGIYLGEGQKLFAELPLGTMGNAFAIFPTFGMRF